MKWWADSVECYLYLRNVQDLLSGAKSAYERRFGEPFCGPITPFGPMIKYHPISAHDQTRHHQFGKKVLPGIFVGYALYAGGICNGDTLVEDVEELQNLDVSDIYVRRLNAKEVLVPKNWRQVYMSVRRWNS